MMVDELHIPDEIMVALVYSIDGVNQDTKIIKNPDFEGDSYLVGYPLQPPSMQLRPGVAGSFIAVRRRSD
jgi:hypothetical protein